MNTQYFMFNSYKAWGALRKAWRGYAIAKNKHEYDNMEYYAAVIQKLRRELGLGISSLPGIGLSKSHLSTKTEIIQEGQQEENNPQSYKQQDLTTGVIESMVEALITHDKGTYYLSGSFSYRS